MLSVVLLGMAIGLMPKVAAVIGLAVAAGLTLLCLVVGGMVAAAGRRMGVVSGRQ